MRKKKKTMCGNIFSKKLYADEGIEMKTQEKYFIKTNTERQFVQDPKTKKPHCILCPRGKECPHAHNAIELDLIPITSNMSNLNSLVKTQSAKLKNAKPIEPWKPSAKSFEPSCKLTHISP